MRSHICRTAHLGSKEGQDPGAGAHIHYHLPLEIHLIFCDGCSTARNFSVSAVNAYRCAC